MTVTDRQAPRARTREADFVREVEHRYRHAMRHHGFLLPPDSTLALESRKRHGARPVSGRPFLSSDPGPIPTEPEIREPRPARPFADLEGHSCRECVTADAIAARVSPWPLILVLSAAFLAGTLAGAWLALSATSSLTPGRASPVVTAAGVIGVPSRLIDDVAVTVSLDSKTVGAPGTAGAAQAAQAGPTRPAEATHADSSSRVLA